MVEKIKEILKKYSTRADEVTLQMDLNADLGLSSFDVVSIVADFEDEFEIEIADRDIRNFIKVNDIVDYLNERL